MRGGLRPYLVAAAVLRSFGLRVDAKQVKTQLCGQPGGCDSRLFLVRLLQSLGLRVSSCRSAVNDDALGERCVVMAQYERDRDEWVLVDVCSPKVSFDTILPERARVRGCPLVVRTTREQIARLRSQFASKRFRQRLRNRARRGPWSARQVSHVAATIGARVGNISPTHAKRLGTAGQRLAFWQFKKLEFVPRESDIYIVTYPKSGTTLMQMLLHRLTSNSECFQHIYDVSPFFDMLGRNDPVQPLRIHTLDNPRILKTHLPFAMLPDKGRFIHVARNPKDVCVSLFFHLAPREVNFDREFVAPFLAGEASALGSWFDHFAKCFPYRKRSNTLFLTYESLRKDLPQQIGRVAEFLNKTISPNEIRDIMHATNLRRMKTHNHRFDPSSYLDTEAVHRPNFIRKGDVGGWKAYLPSASHRAFVLRFEQIERRLGSYSHDELEFLKYADIHVRS